MRAQQGKNAVVYNAARADVILGPIGLLLANAMLGEITPPNGARHLGKQRTEAIDPCFQMCG